MTKRRFRTLIAVPVLLFSGCTAAIQGTPTVLSETSVRLNGTLIDSSRGEASYWWSIDNEQTGRYETPHRTIDLGSSDSKGVAETLTDVPPGFTQEATFCVDNLEGRSNCSKPVLFGSHEAGCGQTITQDTTLSEDLTCSGAVGPGITIGADNVTLDLNGHDISVYGGHQNYPFTALKSTKDGVTIKNGTLTYNYGTSDHASRTLVVSGANVTISDIVVSGVASVETDDSRIVDLAVGSLYGTPTLSFTGSGNRVTGLRAGSTDGSGMAFSGSDNRLVDGNIYAHTGSSVSGDHNTIRDTYFGARDTALSLAGAYNRIVGSEIFGGIYGGPGAAIGGPHATLRDSDFGGFITDALVLSSPYANVVGNKFRANAAGERWPGGPSAADGLIVTDSPGIRIVGNTASGAWDDGMDIDEPTARVGANTTNDNDDLGIEAVPGVTDLGGNTASGNGNPLQCVNVFCQ